MESIALAVVRGDDGSIVITVEAGGYTSGDAVSAALDWHWSMQDLVRVVRSVLVYWVDYGALGLADVLADEGRAAALRHRARTARGWRRPPYAG